MTIFRWAGGLCLFLAALLSSPSIVMAQTANQITAPGGWAPMSAPCVRQSNGTCRPVSAADALPTAAKQESVSLVAANVVSPAQPVYGGAYVFSQSCTAYNNGSATLRYRGADGATMIALVSRTSSDYAGGTQLALGSNVVVDVTLPAGSTGCNATLSRVP